MRLDRNAIERAAGKMQEQLMVWRRPEGHWEGELSSSAMSTATAVYALALADGSRYRPLIRSGLDWLAEHQNADGGWGDTVLSTSNISTTLLAWSAFAVGEDEGRQYAAAATGAETWLKRYAGSLEPERLADAVVRRYGRDRTFAVPILTMCALAGRLGPPDQAWTLVPALPFELAAVPHRWLKWLRLPVVSYALPALVAIGQVRHHHRPTWNPVVRVIRELTRARTLGVLAEIQPCGGGYLEATPLTSFVVMSLAGCGRRDHGVVRRGVEFLIRSARKDGSWPIDTNLATWATTLAVNALAMAREFHDEFSRNERRVIVDWLLAQQHQQEHPFTHADPGGWAWTDLSGGVPDADDTAGVLLALRHLGVIDEQIKRAAALGIEWLVGLQNRDGGIPTFCRGWGTLPFDRSGADLTAHALAAWAAWERDLQDPLRRQVQAAIDEGVRYLAHAQKDDGSWVPLWFGNQLAPSEENPTYGTARVLLALQDLTDRCNPGVSDMLARGTQWLTSVQSLDGGWGWGSEGADRESSIEETAVAVEALAKILPHATPPAQEVVESAVERGATWLSEHTKDGTVLDPSPIGFYFARLWYFERLYPVVFTLSALHRVRRLL